MHTIYAPLCEELGEYVFNWCVNLQHVTMKPKQLKISSFSQSGISHLNFPSVERIEENAFAGANIRSIKVENCK
jgi:hypothetical protein